MNADAGRVARDDGDVLYRFGAVSSGALDI